VTPEERSHGLGLSAISGPIRHVPADERLAALNEAIARRARMAIVVETFREKWRPEGPVDPEGVDKWIHRHSEAPPVDATTAENAAAVRGFSEKWTLPTDGGEISLEEPGSPTHQVIQVEAGSVGAVLKALAERLSKHTPWSTGDCIAFVLADATPAMTLASGAGRTYESLLGRWSRIHIDVDPGASPLVVLELYRQLRDAMGTGRHRRAKRSPALLLAFVAERHGQDWPKIMTAWNEHHPDLAYSQVTNLQRDYARARRQAGEEQSDG
jgi:hypothetical protein